MLIWAIPLVVFLLLVVLVGAQRMHVPHRNSDGDAASPEVVRAYDRISKWPQFKLLRRMVLSELIKHQPTGTVVDIGSGPGYLAALMAKTLANARIVGIDISNEMVSTASNNLSRLGFGSPLEFRQGDARSLPLEDSSADFMVSTFSLHEWSNPRAVLREIRRVLKPSGQFLLFDMRRDSRRCFYWLIRFAQSFVVPAALRRAHEPLNSLLSSYTVSEAKDILSGTDFRKTNISPRLAFIFIWGQK